MNKSDIKAIISIFERQETKDKLDDVSIFSNGISFQNKTKILK